MGVSLLKTTPGAQQGRRSICASSGRNNLLRWDVDVEPNTTGEKALAINYEFKLELDGR